MTTFADKLNQGRRSNEKVSANMTAVAKRRGGQVKMGGSMARPRKQLTKRDLRQPKGRFAAHLQSLMDDRGLTSKSLAAALGFGEPTVRKWLRAEGVPDTLTLERLGKALGLSDYRMVLPPPTE